MQTRTSIGAIMILSFVMLVTAFNWATYCSSSDSGSVSLSVVGISTVLAEVLYSPTLQLIRETDNRVLGVRKACISVRIETCSASG